MVRLTFAPCWSFPDTSTGAISGTPTDITASATYTVTATNTGGSDTATLTIEVNDVAPSSVTYSQSSFTLTMWDRHDHHHPDNQRWSRDLLVCVTLPPCRFVTPDATTGAISGTPTAVTSSASYTVTASNTGGSDSTVLTITVNDVAPSSIAYTPSSFTLTKGTAMTTATPSVSGGAVTSWSGFPLTSSRFVAPIPQRVPSAVHPQR